MAWRIAGSYFETCSCDVVCPCEDVVPFGAEDGAPVRLTGVFHPAGSELNVARATRSEIDAFGIRYEGCAGFSTSEFAWAA